jgi:hypothetical protein
MDVLIIIVSYHTTKFMVDTIDYVFTKTEGVENKTIVVDNNLLENPKDMIIEKYDAWWGNT